MALHLMFFGATPPLNLKDIKAPSALIAGIFHGKLLGRFRRAAR